MQTKEGLRTLLISWFITVFAGITIMTTAGCGGCGVAADPGIHSDNTNAIVDQNGKVTFNPIAFGISEAFEIPVKETAEDTDETIVSASITGPGASSFQILSTFPIALLANQDGSVSVQFAPTASGAINAQLVLQTAKMGNSIIDLSGSGI